MAFNDIKLFHLLLYYLHMESKTSIDLVSSVKHFWNRLLPFSRLFLVFIKPQPCKRDNMVLMLEYGTLCTLVLEALVCSI